VPSLSSLAAQPFDDDSTFADVVHFVHINVIEPHPMGPDVSPYGGRVSESRHSTVLQPTTYDERVEVARGIYALLEGEQLLLVDGLTPGSSVDVIWCTYGTAPNSAFLIRQDGIVEVVQLWLNTGAMEQAIRELVE
jgi:hypothetical protein